MNVPAFALRPCARFWNPPDDRRRAARPAARWSWLGTVLAAGVLAMGTLSGQAAAEKAPEQAEEKTPEAARTFFANHCVDCHAGEGAEAGLDLAALPAQLDRPELLARWVRIFDRVQDGEMPPPEASSVEPAESEAFLKATGDWLRAYQQRQYAELGRVRGRRLTNLHVERTLHDLLGIDIPLASQLPEEPRTAGFTTVADGQPMSHFQLERHLAVVDAALDEAFRRALSSPDEWRKHLDAQAISRTRPKARTREPEIIDGQAVTWSSGLIFYGRLPATTAKESGWYRFTIRASALKSPRDHGVWCTVRSGKCVSSAPLLAWVGAFEATEEPKEATFEAWLPQGHMLEVRPGDTTLKKARFAGGQVGAGEGEPQDVPGVAIDWVKMERFHRGPDNEQVRRLLFADLEVEPARRREPARLISSRPREDAERLLRQFAERAFRRPVADAELAPYVTLVQQLLDDGEELLAAVRGGYRALLCSPRFLYFHETPGPLDDHAVAARLSYLLWSTTPDDELRRLADAGRLRDPQVIHEQVERMLTDPRGRNFLPDFAAEWLDLNQIDFTEPDRKLYPTFDVIVQQSMLDETHAYLETLLRDNVSVGALLDSDYTFLNSRLARYYKIDGVEGDALRRVELRPEHRRGGVLTQGAILKVTANGTNTSPVVRGVWVAERLLGETIPPPPENVPAIEPDIRGAATIREMLAKHRSDSSCASCHVKIDPPGFVLENFDAAGQWRDKYLRLDGGSRKSGATIDASYTLADGRRFENVEQFRKLILADRAALAHNVAEKLLTYGTGAPVGFADREAVEAIVRQAEKSDYGLRSLLHAVVASPLFLTK